MNKNPWNGKAYSQKYYKMLDKRKMLPVWMVREEFLKAFNSNQVVVLVAGTGSGKTTQIPQFVLEEVDKETSDKGRKMMVACTQPSRWAAMSVSFQVSLEMDVTIGDEVGYTGRAKDCSSEKTVLKYLHDGMLLREAVRDPLLGRYKVIVLDEAHERTLATDVLFGLLKRLLRNRPDLKLVVMSATPEAVKFQDYFNDAPVVRVPDMLHQVEVFYAEKDEEDYIGLVVRAVLEVHEHQGPGDILVFLAEKHDIEAACSDIYQTISERGKEVGPVEVLPLYPLIPPAMKQKVYEPVPPPLVEGEPAARKIVVSNKMAETYVIIDGIVYVIDAGYEKKQAYNALTGVEIMGPYPTSKATAHQRMVHAGRTQPGKCFRLYTRESFDQRESMHAQILHVNLVGVVLTLKELGIDNILEFGFMDTPRIEFLLGAMTELKLLGALDDNGDLTELGRIMGQFPLDCCIAKMLVVSPQFKCSNEILSIAAMLFAPCCFVRPTEAQHAAAADKARAKFQHPDGDHLTLLNVYNEFKKNDKDPSWCSENFVKQRALQSADKLRQHLEHLMMTFGIELCSTDFNSPDYYANIRKALVAGFFLKVARLDTATGNYLTKGFNQVVHLSHASSLDHNPEWVIYSQNLRERSMNIIHMVTDIRGEWLEEIAPHYYPGPQTPLAA